MTITDKKYLGWYVLDGHEPRPEPDMVKAAQWFETADRQVAEDFVGKTRVSTVFLAIDHNYSGKGPPILFETMVFGGPLNDTQMRCATWEQAGKQHALVLSRVLMAQQNDLYADPS